MEASVPVVTQVPVARAGARAVLALELGELIVVAQPLQGQQVVPAAVEHLTWELIPALM